MSPRLSPYQIEAEPGFSENGKGMLLAGLDHLWADCSRLKKKTARFLQFLAQAEIRECAGGLAMECALKQI
jgi:hypothetical protein